MCLKNGIYSKYVLSPSYCCCGYSSFSRKSQCTKYAGYSSGEDTQYAIKITEKNRPVFHKYP